jgi:hypothetical protein
MTETGWARIGIRIELSAESDDHFSPPAWTKARGAAHLTAHHVIRSAVPAPAPAPDPVALTVTGPLQCPIMDPSRIMQLHSKTAMYICFHYAWGMLCRLHTAVAGYVPWQPKFTVPSVDRCACTALSVSTSHFAYINVTFFLCGFDIKPFGLFS